MYSHMKGKKNLRQTKAWKELFKSNVKHKLIIGGDPDWMLKALGWKKDGRSK